MRVYEDKERATTLEYYQLQEDFNGENIIDTIEGVKEIIKRDPDYYDPAIFLADILEKAGEDEASEELYKKAGERALELITAEDGDWPDKLLWEWLGNRHIIRALINMGIVFWKRNRKQDAVDLFEKLLKTNPEDNGGVRFYLLAILEGISCDEYAIQFQNSADPDDSATNSTLLNWFKENAPKYDNFS
ncbi:MAG: tetratricopeptide repeat protein [Spirochaetales bacterium]|nr:tetratricopeptide repeat protein [Spirochaetales bacterium]